MDIFKDDLFKNKFFLAILGVIIAIAGIIYLINYNSLESRCTRSVKNTAVFLTPSTRLQQLNLNTAIKQQVQDCLRRGGP